MCADSHDVKLVSIRSLLEEEQPAVNKPEVKKQKNCLGSLFIIFCCPCYLKFRLQDPKIINLKPQLKQNGL